MLVTIFAPGGWDALSLLYPSGDPRYRKLRPSLALKPGDGPVFRSDRGCTGTRRFEPLARLHARGRLTVFPAIGYYHPDQSHFTSRHFWEVGALDPQAGTGWLGRLLDVIGDDDNAMQGLSLDGALMPSLATARVPVATLASPADYGFDSHNVWDVPGELLQDAIGSLGALSPTRDPSSRRRARRSSRPTSCATSSAGSSARTARCTSTRRRSTRTSDFGRRLAGLAALLDANFPIRTAALTGPGLVRHACRPAGRRCRTGRRRWPRASPRSSTTSSGAGSRGACSRSSGASSAAAPQQNDSNGTDHGAAGLAFLMGTKVRQHMVGEFPGLTKGLDRDGNLRATSDFRSRLLLAASSSGSTWTRPASSRTRGRCRE